jgi:hypothetical protein
MPGSPVQSSTYRWKVPSIRAGAGNGDWASEFWQNRSESRNHRLYDAFRGGLSRTMDSIGDGHDGRKASFGVPRPHKHRKGR